MIRWIENVSWDDVKNGWHSDMGENAMLIQIADPATFFPTPKKSFKEVHQFEFLDAEDGDAFDEDFKISDEQAKEIVDLLEKALYNSMNVLVHCHAGICRSGAVVEVGSMMGFTPTDRYRQPNLRVKHKMMKVLGWTYDADEVSEGKGGTISAGGIIIPFSGV
jgi:rhodanese-related sulfurtransferase